MASAQVDALLASGPFDAVAPTLDALELEQGVDAHWPWAAHVLGHLARSDLALAHACFERAPESATADDATEAAFAMVRCARALDFPGLHEAAASPAWSSPTGRALVPLLKRVVESQSARALALMRRAYTTVSVAAAAANLGLTEPNASKTLVETHGWTLDERANVFRIPPPSPTPRQHSAMRALARLTDNAVAADAGAT